MARADLSRIAVLSALPTGLRDEMLRACVTQNVAPGEPIVAESDETTDLFFLLQGRVGVKSFSEFGYEVSYIELAAGSIFGEFSAIDGAPRAATVEALTDVSVARLSRRRLREFLERQPALGVALAQHLVARARALSERIFEFSTLPVCCRVRLELLRLARQTDSDGDRVLIRPAPTHQEIAARISTHREAVSREIADLSARRIVASGRKAIEILSVSALRAAVARPDGR